MKVLRITSLKKNALNSDVSSYFQRCKNANVGLFVARLLSSKAIKSNAQFVERGGFINETSLKKRRWTA